MPANRVTDAARSKSFGNILINGNGNPQPIPTTALPNRAAISIFNNNAAGGATLYIGYSNALNTSNGMPIPPQTSWAEDVWSGGTAASLDARTPLIIYGTTTANNTVDVRYTESGGL